MKRVFDALIFLAGVLICVQISTVGTLFGTEFILIALLPIFVGIRISALREKRIVQFLFAGCLWLGAQIVTDVVRDIPFADFSRGWAKISFLMINAIVLFLLMRDRPDRMLFFASGFSVGTIFRYFVAPSSYAIDFPWKFGVGAPITMLVIIVLAMKAKDPYSLRSNSVILGLGLLNIALGFRSLGLTCIGTAVFILAAKRLMHRKISSTRFWITSAATGVVVIAALQGYQSAATAGWLGEYELEKAQLQIEGEFGIFLGGRVETLGAVAAIQDAPILGHGSWAKDPKYFLLMVERLRELGYPAYNQGEELIPSHSFLLGAWVDSGLAGAAFWFCVLVLTIGVLKEALSGQLALMPFIIFIVLLTAWNILFSPFGAEHRVLTGFATAVVLHVHTTAMRRLKQAPVVAPL